MSILQGLDPQAIAEHFGEVDTEYTWLQEPQTMTHSDEVAQLRAELEAAKAEATQQSEYIQSHGLTEFEMSRLKAQLEAANKRAEQAETDLATAIGQNEQMLKAVGVENFPSFLIRIAELESERATLRLSLNTTNVIVNDQIGKIADLIKERDAANRQLEFFRNQFPTAARNWDRVNGASDSGDGVGDEGWQYYISSQ